MLPSTETKLYSGRLADVEIFIFSFAGFSKTSINISTFRSHLMWLHRILTVTGTRTDVISQVWKVRPRKASKWQT